jgi:serine/threonine-protein kinase
VVTVHDFGLAGDNRAFLVMELLHGATLREVLRRDGRLTSACAIALMRDLCAAVDAAHRRQLVHRDLKPENVFLVEDAGSPRLAKVLDFGIAKVLAGDGHTATATSTGAGLGTLHYMGPEQLRGGAVDPSWDLWALAVVAYEALTGALPFDTTSAADYQSAVLAGRVTPVTAHLPGAPAALQGLFERWLAADRGQRPPGAAALLADLERVVDATASW